MGKLSIHGRRIPELLQGYLSENIRNLSETACFWRALPDHGFRKRGSQCKGGKKVKQRVTIALIANADGEKRKLPMSFGNLKIQGVLRVCIDRSNLPVPYFSRPKGWMTGEILDKVLSKCDSIALLMDNAGCHPPEIKDKYSNINFTQCNIQVTTTGFRYYPELQGSLSKIILHFVISKIDECDTGYQVSEHTSSN